MTQPHPKPPSGASLELKIWSRLLLSPLPWVGKGLQRLALIRLGKAAQAGDLHAGATLGLALDLVQTAGLRAEIEHCLSAELPPGVTDRLWEDWFETRQPSLGNFLSRHATPARPQSRAWVLSQAFLGRLGALKSAAPARIVPISTLLLDPDPNITNAVQSALLALTLPESRNELVRLWA
jgi:hypothetical protein